MLSKAVYALALSGRIAREMVLLFHYLQFMYSKWNNACRPSRFYLVECWLNVRNALKRPRKCLHFDEIIITGSTGSCQNDNFPAVQPVMKISSKWRHFRFSVEPQITKFMGPTYDPPGSCRPQMAPSIRDTRCPVIIGAISTGHFSFGGTNPMKIPDVIRIMSIDRQYSFLHFILLNVRRTTNNKRTRGVFFFKTCWTAGIVPYVG